MVKLLNYNRNKKNILVFHGRKKGAYTVNQFIYMYDENFTENYLTITSTF